MIEGDRVRKWVATLVAVSALLAGCGGGVEGSAIAAERWDPCSIPDDALEPTGLDPNYKDVGWGKGITVSDWSICTFRGPTADPTYFFNMKSSILHTIDEARSDSSYSDGVDLSVGERDAYRFKTNVSRSIQDCNIAVAVLQGVVVFTVNTMGNRDTSADLCELVNKHATDLAEYLPPIRN